MSTIEITIKDALRAYNELAAVKLTKFDKQLRKAAVSNFVELSRISKENQAYQEALKDKIFEDMKDEITVVSELRSRMSAAKTREELAEINRQIVCEHSEFLKAEEEYGNLLKAKESQTVEVALETVDSDKWMECLISAEIDFTSANIAALNCMLTNKTNNHERTETN